MSPKAPTKKAPFNLILLGDPAAGKATQAERLVRKYKMYDLDMGKILRSPKYKKLGRYDETAGKGILSPTQLVRNIFRETIGSVRPEQGILFNGTPKMFGEAKIVHRLLQKTHRAERTIFMYLGIPEAEMLKRTTRRRENGASRSDDDPASLRNRMRYYRKHIRPIRDLYEKTYPSVAISGMGTREEIFRRIAKWLRKYV